MNGEKLKTLGPERHKRILIVDSFPLERAGLAGALEQHDDFQPCAEAASAPEALVKIQKLNPDLVVLESTSCHSHWLELIKDIRHQFPLVFVLVLSAQEESSSIRRGIQAGAHGFITKREPVSEVIKAVECIFAGEIYVSRRVTTEIANQMAGRLQGDKAKTLRNLTDREWEVFELIGDGLGSGQIAAKLHLGKSTVETYRNRIREKLELGDGGTLLQAAIRWKVSRNLEMPSGDPGEEPSHWTGARPPRESKLSEDSFEPAGELKTAQSMRI